MKVEEISGNCGAQFAGYACGGSYTTAWAPYAATSYGYNALDLLTTVTNNTNNTTTNSYDSLGRKTQMIDPDMGTWNYSYDANSNLTSQLDARAQKICFYYDALNRLTGKHYQGNSACPAGAPAAANDLSYSYDQGSYGKGQRSAMSVVGGANTDWQYDARGRTTQALYSNVPGLPATQNRLFKWDYDLADRMQKITYPAIGTALPEELTYSYDAAWRPTSACSNIAGQACYVTSASYSALDQPKQWNFGNSAIQSWSYDTTMQRLNQLQVGISGSLGSMLDRAYSYDDEGNVASITEGAQVQAFDYDHRDRLVHMGPTHMAGLGMLASLGQAPAARGLASAPAPASAPAASAPAATVPALNDLRTGDLSPDRAAMERPAPPALLRHPSARLRGAAQDVALPLRQERGADLPLARSDGSRLQSTAAPLPDAANTVNAATPPTRPDFGRLPLAFIPNRGLADARARFLVRSGAGTLFFTPDEVVLALPDASRAISTTVARVRYEGANLTPTLTARNQLPGLVNFFTGVIPALWQTDLPTYGGISYAGLYAGIDLQYDGSDGKLKSTFVVAPGADPSRIGWSYPGATDLQIDATSGDLIIRMPAPGAGRAGRTLIERAPLAWQDIDGRRVPVGARFAIDTNRSVSFVLGSYDTSQPLLIDPILTYSSYLGGTGGDTGDGIAVDSAGNIYVAGSTRSSNFPTSAGPFQSSRNGAQDAYVTKLNPSGSTVLYSTYLGGSLEDEAHAVAIDSSGKIFLTGETRSSNFPMQGALDSSYGGGTCGSDPCNDVFITKLDPTLSGSAQLKYSTYIGGTGEDIGYGIAADSTVDSNVYVTGEIAGGLPIPSKYYDNSVSGTNDAFLIKLKTVSTGSSANKYATYLGGSGDDKGAAVAIDSSGNAYVTGATNSSAYPTKNAYQASNAGSDDAFVTKLNPTASSNANTLVYSTYLGGSAADKGNGITVDAANNAYITGYTDSTAWPTVTPWQATKTGDKDAVLAQVNTSLVGLPSLVYSTYIGGTNEDRGLAIARNTTGLIYLTGLTRSSDYPQQNPVQAGFGGGTCGTISCTDTFITAFNLAGNTPIYSTFLGGVNDDQGNAITADSSGAAYIAGTTYSTNFPTASPRQGTFGGGTLDGFVAKLTLPLASFSAATVTAAEGVGTLNLTVNLSAASAYTVTVGYSTANGSATAGNDYLAQAGTLVFAPSQTSTTISIAIVNDPSDEPNETFTVTLTNPNNAALGTPSSSTVTITDDDPPPTVSWQAANFSVGEAAGTGLVTALLSAASAFTITVAYATSNGSATAGSDYTAKSGTLTFAPGLTSQSVSISILNDTLQESSETITLTLSAPTNAALGAPNPATLTIIDDETPPAPSEEFYTYDQIGNMLSKTGVGTYTNGANGTGTGAGPHRINQLNGGAAFVYDANGNLTSGGGATHTWDMENRPLTSSTTSGSESYAYDADGERVQVVAGSTTTVYLGGLWEETSAGATKAYYAFGGQTVALRDSTTGVAYLHGDHLGSVSVVSGAGASLLSSQRFDPWGKLLSGSITQTRKNYTGQYLDTTGLLYYNARYYDPNLGRFLSADTVVPGAGALTLAPSDATSAALFKQGGKDKDGKPTAPQYPQTLNRYSYAENNPVVKTDPSGHCSGGSTWNNFVSIFNGTCFQRGMAIMAHARTPGEWALGAFAAVGPSAAIAMFTAGTFGLGAAAIEGTGLTTVGTVGVAAEVTGNTAYEIAKEGGRNAGLLRTFSTRSLGEIQRGVNSLEKGAIAHLDKLADPGRYAERWGSMSTQEQEGLLRFWQKEAARYAEQAEVLRGLLKEQ